MTEDHARAATRFVDWMPDAENAARIFVGDWSSDVPGLPGTGQALLFNDYRILWFKQRLKGYQGKRVLELGPLEGGHTYMMTSRGAEVLAIESNTRAWMRCLAVKNHLDISNAKFLLGDFRRYLDSDPPPPRFDFVLASGVLYHMTDPVRLLTDIARITDAIGLWTHYFDEDVLGAKQDVQGKFSFEPRHITTPRGRTVRYYDQAYLKALDWGGFCGGSAPDSVWMARDEILDVLGDEGFDCEIGVEDIDHPNGPAFCVFAQRHSRATNQRLQESKGRGELKLNGSRERSRLAGILPLLRCPETGQDLVFSVESDALLSEDGLRRWPLVVGRPLLFPGLQTPIINSEAHLSNPLPESALTMIHSTSGPILHLSAGGTAERFEHVIEAEAAVFRHTDLICDSHRLPFKDGVFEAVIALNAFEHYRDPRAAADEIRRVLRPGGRVLIHTAFLQPLHEAPWHFYNCTRYGLEAWFADFETERLHVSENFHPGYSLSWLASDCEVALRSHLSDVEADKFLAAPLHQIVSLWRLPQGVKTADPLWNGLAALPQDAQEGLAAGFELIGRKPLA